MKKENEFPNLKNKSLEELSEIALGDKNLLENIDDVDDNDMRDFSSDAHFRSELEYDGYDEIDEYDNEAYGSDVKGKGNPEENLKLKDRKAELDDRVEESLLDRQENKK